MKLRTCFMMFLIGLMISGCAAKRVQLPEEWRLLDPTKLQCTCPGLNLGNFYLLGTQAMAIIYEKLMECQLYMEHHSSDTPDPVTK